MKATNGSSRRPVFSLCVGNESVRRLRRAVVEVVEQRVLLSATLQYRPVGDAGRIGPPVTFQSPAGVLVQDFTPEQQSLLSEFAAPAFDMFLKVDGISGESTDAKHQDAIDIQAFSWGGDLAIPTGTGGGGASQPEFQELHFASRVSAASPVLLDRLNDGQHITDAKFFVRRAGKTQQEFVKLDLDDVLVSSYQVTTDAAGLVEEFTLNFGRINLEYRPPQIDGTLGAPVVFDSGSNTGLRVEQFVPEQRSLLDAGAVSPSNIDFFLTLDGVAGESTDAKHEDAIDVVSFSWGADQTGGSSAGGGGGAGRARFEELHVVSRVSKASPVLMQRLATGHHITEGKLVARRSGKDQQEFYKINFDDVIVSSYEVSTDGPGLVEEFTLNFGAAALEYRPQRPDGSPGAPVTFATGTAGVLVDQFQPEQRSLVQSGFTAPTGVDFFLTVDGVPGESADAKHQDAIDVLSFSWGADQTGGSSAGGGGGAGFARFQELHVVSRLSKASPLLLTRLTKGQHIPNAVLAGRRDGKDQQEFFTLTLDDVHVSSHLVTTASDGTLLEEFTLDFDRAREQYRVRNPDGTSSPGAAFDSGPGARVEDFAPQQVSLLQGGFAEPQVDMFLDIDGIPGESTDAKHEDQIDVLAFSWGADLSAGSTTGGGGAGRATLHELHFVSRVSKASPLLLDHLADGRHIQWGTLSVARPGTKASIEFLQVNLDDVIVSSYQVAPRNGILVEEFTLSFSDAQEQYRPQNPDGSLGGPVTFDAPLGVAVQDFSPEQRSLLQTGFGALGGTVQSFLSITGIPGESADAKHNGQIDVISFSWGANQVGGSSTGGGGGAGRATFQELHVVSRLSKASPILLDRMARGVHVQQADLSFVRSGKSQVEFLRLDFDGVLVGSHQMIQQADGSVLEEFTLVFDRAQATYRPQRADGSAGGPSVVFATGQNAFVERFTPEQASLLELGRVNSGTSDLFLRIDGIAGESADAKHRNEIDVQSFSWGGHQSGGTSTGGGAGAGRATLHDLHVVTRFNAASPRLLQRLANGQHIPAARLALRRGGENPAEILALNLEDVTVSSYQVTTALDGTLLEEFTLHFGSGAPGNRAPVANADAAQTPEDSAVVVDVLANDTDADNDVLTVTSVGTPAHGTATLNVDGTVTYAPAPNFNGTDAFTYTVIDDQGGSDTATVTVTVTPVNDKPVADPQIANVAEDGSVAITLSGTDVETAPADLLFTITRLPQHGSLTNGTTPVQLGDTFTGPPTLMYQPGLCAEPGTESFGFTVTDTGDPAGTPGNVLTSDEAAVTLNVAPSVSDGSLSFSNGILRIGGTGGADAITVSRSGSNLVVSGSVSGQVPLAGVTEVRVWGRSGNDLIAVNADVVAFLSGGAGDDDLSGGSGADLLLGGDGDDKLGGASGDDVLIGGRGADRLVGAAGNDLLIGGALDCRFTLPTVRSLGAAWATTGLPVSSLRLVGPGADVNDTESDHLTGASGEDWFVVSAADKYQDAKPGKKGDAVSILT